MINWTEIHHVLLDMDGTLLDLHFDNYFWQKHLPKRYAECKNLPPDQAEAELMAMYQQIEGTLNWYSVDYWTETLGMDVVRLKHEVAHLITEHPKVPDFLRTLQRSGLHTVLVTNAHRKTLALKIGYTKIGQYLEKIVCSHELGLPKEDPEFWERLQTLETYDPAHTLLVDDNHAVLRAAREYGIAHLLSIATPDTQRPTRQDGEFPLLESFGDIIPPPCREATPPGSG